jgi:flagella basal body P-ring formation protein FlgA
MKQQFLILLCAMVSVFLLGMGSQSVGLSDHDGSQSAALNPDDISMSEAITLQKIEKANQSVDVIDRVTSVIRDYVAKRLLKTPLEINVKRVNPALTDKGISPSDQLEIEQGPEGVIGRLTFLISVKRSDGTRHHHWVNADVSLIRKVLVATRPIRRKEAISRDALSLETISQTQSSQHYLESPDDLLGKRATRMIGQSVPITMDMVEEAPIIRRGDPVMLVVETDDIRIATSGRAKEDGFLGRPLAVITEDGSRTVYGTVMSPSTIIIGF